MKVFNCFFIFVLFLCGAYGKEWSEKDKMAARSWQAMELWIKDWFQDTSLNLRRILENSTVSPECARHSRITLDGLDNMHSWAVIMLDSWAKVPTGFSSGVSGFHGDFDACVSVIHPDKHFQGKYCNVRAKQPLPDFGKVHLWSVMSRFPEFAKMGFTNNTIMHDMIRDWIVWYYRYPYKIGICVPSTCSDQDLIALGNQAFKGLDWTVSVDDCQMKQEISLSSVQIITIACIVVLVAVIFIATYLDDGCSTTGLSCHFSISRNWQSLTQAPATENKFNFLDGLRVFLTYWTVLMHTCSMYEPTLLSGCYTTVYMVESPLLQVIMNGWASVDSFFCITGFLLGYTLLRNLERNKGQINWVKFVFRRICRLSPTLWALLGLVYLTPLVGSGSHWPEVFGKDVERCHHGWLPVVLFFNNWFRYDKMCLPMTWYLSVDVQLYIIGSLFVYLIYRWPSTGIKICLLGVLIPSLWLGYVVYVNDLQPSLIWETFDLEFREEMLRLTYLGSSPHLAPFLIGILTGYLLNKYPKVTFGKRTLAVCWSASMLTYAAVILSGYPWHNARWPSPAGAALFQATHKIFWAMATGWVIYSCATGQGGYFDRAFAWSGFATLSKLSFLMGLLNIPIIRFKNSLLRRYISLTLLDLFYDFLGHYVMSITVSVLLFLFVESPFASLSDSYLREQRKVKQG